MRGSAALKPVSWSGAGGGAGEAGLLHTAPPLRPLQGERVSVGPSPPPPPPRPPYRGRMSRGGFKPGNPEPGAVRPVTGAGSAFRRARRGGEGGASGFPKPLARDLQWPLVAGTPRPRCGVRGGSPTIRASLPRNPLRVVSSPRGAPHRPAVPS